MHCGGSVVGMGAAWEHSPGRETVGGLEGAAGDWQPDLVDKSPENNSP